MLPTALVAFSQIRSGYVYLTGKSDGATWNMTSIILQLKFSDPRLNY